MAVIYGFHVIEEHIKSSTGAVTLYVSGKGPRTKKIISMAENRGIPVVSTEKEELTRLCGSKEHRGVGLEIRGSEILEPENLETLLVTLSKKSTSLLLVLDGITDPHNLGAIIRSADQFSADAVIVPSRRSAGENLTVEQTSAGASRYIKLITVANLERSIRLLQKSEYWVCGADMEQVSASKAGFPGRVALVLGSEGKGMSSIVRDACDQLVSIPMKGHIDSLNVSVAAGILMYEIRRQHGW